MPQADHLEVRVERRHPDARLPHRATSLSSGWDLHACTPVTIPAGGWVLVPTGLAVAIPAGFEMQVRPRSGLALRHGVTVLNAPGTIDADYRGEVGVILINHGTQPFEVGVGDRIAQAVVARHETVQWHVVSSLDATERGSGGFGHSGR